jgi:hypothetical protein
VPRRLAGRDRRRERRAGPFEPTSTSSASAGWCSVQEAEELLASTGAGGTSSSRAAAMPSLCPGCTKNSRTLSLPARRYIWKDFCRDFQIGRTVALSRERRGCALRLGAALRPVKLDRYQVVSLQFSRGCPFRCEFCDIIVMFGRKPRTKTLRTGGQGVGLPQSGRRARRFLRRRQPDQQASSPWRRNCSPFCTTTRFATTTGLISEPKSH